VLRARIRARPFMERVISLARTGRTDEALALCAEHRSTLPDLGLVLLRSRASDEQSLRAIAQAARLTAAPALSRRLRWLTILASLSLLLGGLGAIANLHDTLGGDVAQSARYALRPLGAGLLAAIPLIIGHQVLHSQARATLELLEEFSARLVNALLQRPDVRLGHRD